MTSSFLIFFSNLIIQIFKFNHNVETEAARKCGIVIAISEGEDREVRGITWAHTDSGVIFRNKQTNKQRLYLPTNNRVNVT